MLDKTEYDRPGSECVNASLVFTGCLNNKLHTVPDPLLYTVLYAVQYKEPLPVKVAGGT